MTRWLMISVLCSGLLRVIVKGQQADIIFAVEQWKLFWTSADALSSEAVTFCCIVAVTAEIMGHRSFFLKIYSLLSGEVPIICFFQSQYGLLCVGRILQEFYLQTS